jgi:hypothetical protein
MRKGALGEIIPEPLVHGLTEEDLLAWWAELSEEEAGREDLSLAIGVYHQRRMRAMFDGPHSEVERGLVEAVLSGVPVSIAPVGAQSTDITAHLTFVPVLQYLGENRWRLGTPDYGRNEVWDEAVPCAAVQRAQQLYRQWFDEEL